MLDCEYNCRIWRRMSFLRPGVVKQHKTPNSDMLDAQNQLKLPWKPIEMCIIYAPIFYRKCVHKTYRNPYWLMLKTDLNLHKHSVITWCSKPIKIAIKTHLNLHNIHSDILDAQNQLKFLWKTIEICIIYTTISLMLKTNKKYHENPFKFAWFALRHSSKCIHKTTMKTHINLHNTFMMLKNRLKVLWKPNWIYKIYTLVFQ